MLPTSRRLGAALTRVRTQNNANKFSLLQRGAVASTSSSSRFGYREYGTDAKRISLEHAKEMPTEWSHMQNSDLLAWCGSDGTCGANEERVARHIMVHDNSTWEEAQTTIFEMRRYLDELDGSVFKVPYKIGLASAGIGMTMSTPMIFERNTVQWFNDKFVTMETPPPGDLDTWLEVGSWSWSWMEPCLGQLSFLILCAQFARNQMVNLQIKPYTNWVRSRRARAMRHRYPQYCMHAVSDYAKTYQKGDSSLCRETEVLARANSTGKL